MVWLPTVKKLMIFLFVLTQLTNVTDRQTHTHTQTQTQTPHDDIGRVYVSRRTAKITQVSNLMTCCRNYNIIYACVVFAQRR